MNIREFAKPVTAKSLNESLAKRYGQKISLDKFTLEQLQDARNKLRTKLSQVEMTEQFDAVAKSDSYHKSKLMLDVLNAEISERGDIHDEAMVEKDHGKRPDSPDLDNDGDTEEPIADAAKDAEEANDDKKAESIVKEGAEDQAEITMAAKDMVDRVTNWMEDTAEMQTESMLELADAIRDEMGSDKSAQFVDSVKPALEALYASMEQARESLTAGVGIITGEGEPAAVPMGAEDVPVEEPAMEPTVDMEAPAGDVAAPAAGGEAEAGREMRESKKKIKRESMNSQRLGNIIAKGIQKKR